ncbi:MAG: aminodeoxychorismate/anthranilate synthase component II [Crocinitomicaceae bacterium]|nr:aminodeoxychorismate/anthranilate synthase component II [Crocinitomicaceae bacterium]
MKIAVIDNYDSFVYNLVRYVEESIEGSVEVYRNDHIDFEALKTVDAILLSPGPGLPSEAGDLLRVIEEYHLNKPMLGVCLGHQAITEYFGGTLIQNATPLHGKASEIQHSNSSPLFEGIEKRFSVGRYHSWSVSKELPENLYPIAATDDGEVMAIAHKNLNVFGVQFHPESILTPKGRTMIENWITTLNN